MKKLIAATLTIAACAVLCVGLWPRNPESAELVARPPQTELYVELVLITAPAPITTAAVTTEKEETPARNVTPPPEPICTPEEKIKVTAAEPVTPSPTAQVQTPPPTSADPYYTDIYPNNVYSEELI